MGGGTIERMSEVDYRVFPLLLFSTEIGRSEKSKGLPPVLSLVTPLSPMWSGAPRVLSIRPRRPLFTSQVEMVLGPGAAAAAAALPLPSPPPPPGGLPSVQTGSGGLET